MGLFFRVFYKEIFLFGLLSPRVFFSLFKLFVLDLGDLLLESDLFCFRSSVCLSLWIIADAGGLSLVRLGNLLLFGVLKTE